MNTHTHVHAVLDEFADELTDLEEGIFLNPTASILSRCVCVVVLFVVFVYFDVFSLLNVSLCCIVIGSTT